MVYVIRKIKNYKILVIPILMFFMIQGFFLGYQNIKENKDNGAVLKEGCLFLKGITSPDKNVMSESYPYVIYYADRITVRPPKDKKIFYSLIEGYNIKYILIDLSEPGNPDYLLNELNMSKFEKIKSFLEFGKERVIIYRKL
jgi:hypothetical protein